MLLNVGSFILRVCVLCVFNFFKKRVFDVLMMSVLTSIYIERKTNSKKTQSLEKAPKKRGKGHEKRVFDIFTRRFFTFLHEKRVHDRTIPF
jgi:hypothetical protein